MKRVFALAVGLLFALPSLSQPYPAKSLRIIVPFAPGASGNIGAEAVAKAAPDGTTILMATTGVIRAANIVVN